LEQELNQLHNILKETKLKYDSESLAEALWLSRYMDDSVEVTEEKEESKTEEAKPEKKEEKREFVDDGTQKEGELKPTADKLTIYVQSQEDTSVHVSTQKTKSKGMSIGIRQESYSLNHNTLYMSLRHFRQKRVSRTQQHFDVNKTVDFMADTKLFMPHYQVQYENRFKLLILIDTSDTMELWREEVGSITKSMRHFNLFNAIETLYIESEREEPHFYKSKFKEGTGYQNIGAFLSSDTMVMVVSDMSATSWRSGALVTKMSAWQKRAKLFVLQMFPSHLWGRTSLKEAELVRFYTNRERQFNQKLKSDVDDILDFAYESYSTKPRLNLPIATIELNSLEALSRTMVGKEKSSVRGAIVFEKSQKQGNQSNITDIEKVTLFDETSSQLAQKLLRYLSVVPLDMTVMKMVQRLMLPDSQKLNLAEVLTSGLISKEDELYEFTGKGTRDILQNQLGTTKYIETIEKLSQYVEENIGFSSFFKAILQESQTTKQGKLSKLDTEFARINMKRLQRLGGEYEKIAQRLMKEMTVYVPFSKRFQMGSNEREDEKPLHEVTLNYDFEIAQTPVTVGEFRTFVEDSGYVTEAEKGDGAYVWDDEKSEWGQKKDANWQNPYFEQSDDHPVVCVSWNDAQAYIKWLNEKTEENYRLPTEAEWEFSCRAGTTTKWHFGNNESELEKYAWYGRNGGDGTKPVATKEPNQWGLYDMHGNVWEWCLDDYVNNYKDTPRDGSANEKREVRSKVLRGGSWYFNALSTRSAYRFGYFPGYRNFIRGFRLLRTLP
jgi:formylglycine-generating enzyme required for sulfatase activity